MVIHNKGEKAARDREIVLKNYRRICEYFKVPLMKEKELANTANTTISKIAEDIFNRQEHTAKRKFFQKFFGRQNPSYRIHPNSPRWWIVNLIDYIDHLKIVRAQKKLEKKSNTVDAKEAFTDAK